VAAADNRPVVTSGSGDRSQLLWSLLTLVAECARELGRNVALDDLFLLALGELDESSPARRALVGARVDFDEMRAQIRTSGDAVRDGDELVFPPSFYAMKGRAEAFAATLGDGTITAEHVLLALVWDPEGTASGLLWKLGVSSEQVVERLGELGVAVPTASLPPRYELEWGERVWFDREHLRRVLDYVPLHLPPGAHWGFNYEDERAWACAEAGVDLHALVQAALTQEA
jgi:hypothetical protein